MTRIDLYPNPAFVEAIRKDGYKEYSSDVFDTEDKTSKYYFIQEAISMTDRVMENLIAIKLGNTEYYNKYSNTIDYLINYYEFLLEKNIVKSYTEVGAAYGGGIVTDFIKAVISKKSILYTVDRNNKKNAKKWPEEMNCWFILSEKGIISNSKNFAPVIKIAGLKQDEIYYFNLILISPERNKGFEYNAKNIFMNWNGNPLNNKTD
jgi:hypothetical protein